MQLTYTITINKPQDFVFNKIMDKSVYPDWAEAWGEGMTYEGEWKEGGNISFFDQTQGGTKILVEKIEAPKHIRAKHVAMVNPQNIEVELADEMMKKWIGSLEEYYFEAVDDSTTELKVVMTVDPSFQAMFDGTWPNALELFKGVCER